MSRIKATFAKLLQQQRAAFIPFIMSGDHGQAASQLLLDSLPECGADVIELGMPFSDPMADGPTIQAAGLRAIEGGATLKSVLKQCEQFRRTHAHTPIVLMGYYNPMYQYGVKQFAADACAAGADGVLIVDVPPEEAAELAPCREAGLDVIALATPTSDAARLKHITANAHGYLYYVSVTGITGQKAAQTDNLETHVNAAKRASSLPVAVGFGVSTPEQVRAIASYADGVVVGSAIIKDFDSAIRAESSFATAIKHSGDFIKTLSAATQRAHIN